MYFHENIFSLILVICVAGMLYPYALPGAGALIRLTSIYRPLSLTALLLYGLIIVFQPALGPMALGLVPLFAVLGIRFMALELEALRTGIGTRAHQIRQAGRALLVLGLVYTALAFLPLQVTAIAVNFVVALCYAWASWAGFRLWQSGPSFQLLTLFASCLVGTMGMVLRGLAYLENMGSIETLVFPEPPFAFFPRVLASFAAVFAAVALNYEYLRRLAYAERQRTEELDDQLIAALTRITERRALRGPAASRFIGLVAEALAQHLLQEKWLDIRTQADLPPMLRRCAALCDIGLIGVPDLTADKGDSDQQENRDVFARHPVIGANFLKALEDRRRTVAGNQAGRDRMLRLAADIAGQYREHWDGSGFPHGLIGRQISPAARIVAVARAFVKAIGPNPIPAACRRAALAIKADRHSRYDPAIVDVLMDQAEELGALWATAQAKAAA